MRPSRPNVSPRNQSMEGRGNVVVRLLGCAACFSGGGQGDISIVFVVQVLRAMCGSGVLVAHGGTRCTGFGILFHSRTAHGIYQHSSGQHKKQQWFRKCFVSVFFRAPPWDPCHWQATSPRFCASAGVCHCVDVVVIPNKPHAVC